MRLSVRELVEFSIHGEDLARGFSARAMADGTLSHKARQKLLGEGWETETPLTLECAFIGDETLTLSGRMDGWRAGEPPEIEEMKLNSGSETPSFALPAHRAQAVVYAHMVCRLYGYPAVMIAVCYVNQSGMVTARFSETVSAETCSATFNLLLDPFVAWQKRIRSHRSERDTVLLTLPFPYPAYRSGQREMAVQVYTAITRRSRLLSEMPTGTGKSAAVIYPALMAMGRGLTEQIFYLTARTTQRKAAQECLGLFREKAFPVWTLTLSAKDKQCLREGECDTETCPYAIGFFTRLADAVDHMLPLRDWNEETVAEAAARYSVCPFEFSLTLAEIADVVICDYNYAFDPYAHIKRIFDARRGMTLLVDEAHNLSPRVRDMLSASVDCASLRALKKLHPKRNSPLHKALTAAVKGLEAMPPGEGAVPFIDGVLPSLFNTLYETLSDGIGAGAATTLHFEVLMALKTILSSLNGTVHAYIKEGRGRNRSLTAFCLDAAPHILSVTAQMTGVIYFSATLSPLSEMKRLLGADHEDAVYRSASPFPPENFYIQRVHADTRYGVRRDTAEQVAGAIRALFTAKTGKYIAFFPSFAYLTIVAEHLADLPLAVQERGMDEAARDAFLSLFQVGSERILGLCVLGGVFAEGIDLPGDRLVGAALVGVGLPQVNIFNETLRAYYEERFQSGFRFAYQIPGMHKIAQAAGRVIRSEFDRGAILLIDERYFQKEYEKLCPPHWSFRAGGLADGLAAFWKGN